MQQPPSPPHHSNPTSSLPKKRSVEAVYKRKYATSQSMPQPAEGNASPSSSSTTLPTPYPDDDEDHRNNTNSEEEGSVHLDCSCQTLEWCRQQEASAALQSLIQDAALPLLRPPRPGFPLLVIDMDRTLIDGTPIGKRKLKSSSFFCFVPPLASFPFVPRPRTFPSLPCFLVLG